MSNDSSAIIDWLFALEFPVTEFDPGHVLIEEGSIGNTVYVLDAGEVRISQHYSELARVDARGAMLGEIAAILHIQRTASVTVEQPSSFYVIEDLEEFIAENPVFAMLILESMATRIIERDKNHCGIYVGLQKLREKASTLASEERLVADPGVSQDD